MDGEAPHHSDPWFNLPSTDHRAVPGSGFLKTQGAEPRFSVEGTLPLEGGDPCQGVWVWVGPRIPGIPSN